MNDINYDCVIIGGGPAGLSAAVYLLRAGISTAIIAKNGGALEKAEKIENYFGIKSISGVELIKSGEEQISFLGGKIIRDEITSISYDGNYTAVGKNAYKAATIIIAAGADRKKARIKNIDKFEGSGVSYCAVCDAFFYRNKSVAVLGSGDYALHEISELGGCSKLYLITNGAKLSSDLILPKNVEIIKEPVSELLGGENLSGIRFKNGAEIEIQGLFIAEGIAGGAAFARSLGLELINGIIKTDEKMRTSANGVFAAGDSTGGVLQVSVAVGEGAKAALSAIEYIKKSKS